MGNEQSAGGVRGTLPQGMQAMGSQLQKKFAKGVQYNMKVIIKGDRNTGKTCLLKRLQGGPFLESYTPTQEIQAASIHWNYRASDDVVKVEVWDVVDKGAGAQRKRSGSLKLQTEDPSAEATDPSTPNLDAGFVDVYKNTNGVILTLDICKAWTWKYVQREVETIPSHIPIIILGNFRDMGEHRVVDRDDVEYFIRSLERPEDAGEVRYAEVSMKNAFGLKYLHKFFNLPFLRLQRATLLAQLKTNEDDLASTQEELNFHLESEEQNYDVFVAGLEKRKKEHAERVALQKAAAEAANDAAAGGQPAAGSKPSPAVAARSSPQAPAQRPAASAAASTRAQATAQPPRPGDTPSTRAQAAAQPPRSGAASVPPPATAPTAAQQPAAAAAPATAAQRPSSASPAVAASSGPSFSQRFASKLGWRRESAPAAPADDAAAQIAAAREARLRGAKPSAENVDEFVPEGGLGDDFLGDDSGAVAMGTADDDDDDSDDARPAVAGFDDIDSDDDMGTPYAAQVTAPADDISDDEHMAAPVITADADDDELSLDGGGGGVVAADEDFDSEPTPPPARKVTNVKASKQPKPVVFEDAVSPPAESSPPTHKKPAKASPKVKPAAAAAPAMTKGTTPPRKKKPAKKPVVVSSSEPSDSEDEAGPTVAPLEGDSGDEIKADTVPVVAEDEDFPSGIQPVVGDNFMDHWLDGGAMPPTAMSSEPLQPVSAASLLTDAPLIPATAETSEKPKKKKKKKEAATNGAEASGAADGVEKKKKKKKKAQDAGEGSGEVKRKSKKKPKAEKADDVYLL